MSTEAYPNPVRKSGLAFAALPITSTCEMNTSRVPLCHVYDALPPPDENHEVVGSPSTARPAGNSPDGNSVDAAVTPCLARSVSGRRGSDEEESDDDDDDDEDVES